MGPCCWRRVQAFGGSGTRRGVGNQTANRPEGVADPLRKLWDAEYQQMVALGYLLLRDRATAEDVVQDAFAAVAERLEQLERPGAYLRVTVINGARRQQRKRSRLGALTSTGGRGQGAWTRSPHALNASVPDPADQIDSGPVEDPAEVLAMRACLARISTRQREALVLRYFADLSLADTAATMGYPKAPLDPTCTAAWLASASCSSSNPPTRSRPKGAPCVPTNPTPTRPI